MKIHIKESAIIRPAQETPKHSLRCSELDLLMPVSVIPMVCFYRRPPCNSFNFFEAGLLKEALSKVLVPFYPVAGRLGRDETDRIEIQCNGEGVLFVEAETSGVIDDFDDFESSLKLMQLVPADQDETEDISFLPLFKAQVTHFKCGGVCLGLTFHHTLGDGISAFHFVNSWADMTSNVPITIPPFFDRAILNAGVVPNSPTLIRHTEYELPPSMNNTPAQNHGTIISTAILKLSLDQMNFLKEKSKEDLGSTIKYSRFEILAAHIWRCACKARGLSFDQATKLDMPTNGRSRLSNPKIPIGYVGNLCFSTTPIALSGDIQSKPLSYTAGKIHKAFQLMDDEHMKSALAYLQRQPDLSVLCRGDEVMNCPNLMISNLANAPTYVANFGWGRPIFTRPVYGITDGQVFVLPSPANDASWLVVIDLETNHLQLFKKFFYEIFYDSEIVRSRY